MEAIVRLIKEKANIFILFFLALTFISLINTRYFQDETVSEILSRLKMVSLFFVIVAVVTDRRILKIAIVAFILGSLLTTGVGMYEAATGKAFFKETPGKYGIISGTKTKGLVKTTYGEKGRAQGTYSDPGFHAHAMVIFFGLAVPWVFYSRSKKMKFIVGLLVIFYVINVIATGARTGWVSLGAALLIFLIFLRHRFKYTLWVLSIATVIAIFLALSLFPNLPTFARLQFTKDKSYDWRLDTNRQALEMVRDHPLLGVGTGNYMTEYFNYLSETPKLSRYFMGWLHNSYLQIWAENGTIGLLVFCGFFLCVFLGLMTAYLKAADIEMRALSLGLLTAFTGYAVEFSGVPVLDQEPGWAVLGLSVALIAIVRREKKEGLGRMEIKWTI